MNKSKARKNYLFSAFSKPPRHPLSVVIKAHKTRDVLYVTYGKGRANGGGSWSEDLTKINPRTIEMLKGYFPEKIFNALQTTIDMALSKRRKNAKASSRPNQVRHQQQ
jgi:hypothetical protein